MITIWTNMQKTATLLTVLAAVLTMTGCAGARTEVVAPTANVPVSLSRAVRDAEGVIVTEERRDVVGTLDAEGTAWGMLYSGIRLTPEMDVSDAVNQEVQRLHGDAVINVSIATKQCVLNVAPGFNLLPFWPGCAKIHIHGDIIRLHPAPPPPASTEVVLVASTLDATSKTKSRTKRARIADPKLASRTP